MHDIFLLLRSAIWGDPVPQKVITEEIYHELKAHAVATLFAKILPDLNMSDSLKEKWKTTIIEAISYRIRCQFEEQNIKLNVPYTILKGTSAAQYYPYPEYRTMGDIDIMTSHADYEIACSNLLSMGYIERTSKMEGEFGRHRGFTKNGIEIEVHSFFALLNDIDKAQKLDNYIIDNINSSHILPDPINGLVLLEHIGQHMESGIGLRQIIDWMMFVDKSLQDEKWSEFRIYVHDVGLEKLAKITTRMCEKYLGLRPHDWCKNCDDKIVDQLMNYIMSCGNFGNKRTEENGPGIRVLTIARNPISTFRLLQERGLVNWKVAHNHFALKPFAWMYQIGRYLIKGLGRDNARKKLRMEAVAAKNRRKLFDALEVKQSSKGLVIYDNGKYLLTHKRP